MNTRPAEPSRLLLVEDDPNDVELIRLSLNSYHFARQIDIVHDGQQAIQYLLGDSHSPATSPLPRLVLLDLKLPRLSGIEVLQTLRSHERTRKLVIVVMTSSAEDSDLNACYELGTNSYIVKPLNFQEYSEVARQVSYYWMVLNRPPISSV
ncbi:MAG TPA: response regulator [Synechococcales cyanobacterium M55_K2018_004]|nr:response regulator [Synechococcales cyanobacterium M55_K2018_004]